MKNKTAKKIRRTTSSNNVLDAAGETVATQLITSFNSMVDAQATGMTTLTTAFSQAMTQQSSVQARAFTDLANRMISPNAEEGKHRLCYGKVDFTMRILLYLIS